MIAGGASFAPEPVIVAGAGDRRAQQSLPRVDGAQHRGAEDEELQVVVRRVPGVQEVVPEVVAHAPVQVLARSVDAGKRLLVEQTREPVLRRDALQRLHDHHLVIGGDVGVLEDRRDLVLARRHLVVPRLHRDAALVELELDVHHARQHALGDRAEVLVFHLLALRRLRAEERAAGVDQIGPVEIEVPVDQEVLLLGTARRDDALGVRAEQLQDAERLHRERFLRAQQRRLLVERFAGPAHERRRNHQRRAVRIHEQPRRARRIPGGVAARLERAAHPARREARGVGLALDQFLAAELRDRLAAAVRVEEAVVFFRRDAGERLEPVRVVRGAVLERPILQRCGDLVGDGAVERLAVDGCPLQRRVRLLRQPRLLNIVVERQRTESVGQLRQLAANTSHCLAPVDDALDGVAQRCRSHRWSFPE